MFEIVKKDKMCSNRFSEETINILDQSCKAYNMSRSDYLELLIKNAQTNNAQDIINQTQMLLFQIKEYEKQYTTKIDEVKKLENKITKTKAKISKLNSLKDTSNFIYEDEELKIKEIILKRYITMGNFNDTIELERTLTNICREFRVNFNITFKIACLIRDKKTTPIDIINTPLVELINDESIKFLESEKTKQTQQTIQQKLTEKFSNQLKQLQPTEIKEKPQQLTKNDKIKTFIQTLQKRNYFKLYENDLKTTVENRCIGYNLEFSTIWKLVKMIQNNKITVDQIYQSENIIEDFINNIKLI